MPCTTVCLPCSCCVPPGGKGSASLLAWTGRSGLRADVTHSIMSLVYKLSSAVAGYRHRQLRVTPRLRRRLYGLLDCSVSPHLIRYAWLVCTRRKLGTAQMVVFCCCTTARRNAMHQSFMEGVLPVPRNGLWLILHNCKLRDIRQRWLGSSVVRMSRMVVVKIKRQLKAPWKCACNGIT